LTKTLKKGEIARVRHPRDQAWNTSMMNLTQCRCNIIINFFQARGPYHMHNQTSEEYKKWLAIRQ